MIITFLYELKLLNILFVILDQKKKGLITLKFMKLFASMWHKAELMRHPTRLELTLAGLLVKLANHYTTRSAQVLKHYEHLEYSSLNTLNYCNLKSFKIRNFHLTH